MKPALKGRCIYWNPSYLGICQSEVNEVHAQRFFYRMNQSRKTRYDLKNDEGEVGINFERLLSDDDN